MLLTNACQGTSGTAVSATNTGGPSQFNSIGLGGTGNTLNFDNTHSLRGGTAISPKIVITGGGAYGVWSFTAVTTAYSRAYVYLAAAPGSNTRLAAYIDTTGATLRSAIYIDTGLDIQMVNSAAVTESTSTTLIPTGAWCRIEFDCTGSATVGVLTCRMYVTSPDGSTPDQTLSNTAQNTGGTIGQIWIGSSDSSTATSQTWLDDLGVTDAGPMGASLASATSAAAWASAAADLGGGTGSWSNPGQADGAPDSAYATWTAP